MLKVRFVEREVLLHSQADWFGLRSDLTVDWGTILVNGDESCIYSHVVDDKSRRNSVAGGGVAN